jgi:hypothetical protein
VQTIAGASVASLEWWQQLLTKPITPVGHATRMPELALPVIGAGDYTSSQKYLLAPLTRERSQRMPETTSALHSLLRVLLGVVIGLLPSLLIALANRNSVPALFAPLLAAAYVSFIALAFITTTCLVRSAHRALGVGIALGLLFTIAFYVTLLSRAAGSFY